MPVPVAAGWDVVRIATGGLIQMNLKTGLIIAVVVVLVAVAGSSAYRSFYTPGNVHPGHDGATALTAGSDAAGTAERGELQGKGGLQKMPGG